MSRIRYVLLAQALVFSLSASAKPPGCAIKLANYFQGLEFSKSKTCRGLFDLWMTTELPFSLCQKAFSDVAQYGFDAPGSYLDPRCFGKCRPTDYRCWYLLN